MQTKFKMNLETINPATGVRIKAYPLMTKASIEKRILDSQAAFLAWSEMNIAERGAYFSRLSQTLLNNKKHYAALITMEMGKPLKSAEEEIEKCALVCRHFAKNAQNYLVPIEINTEMKKSYVAYRPLGIVFAVMPWNFPFWQVFRFAAPALMAGNTALLKHAPITTGCGLAIEAAFKEARFPEHVFQTLVIDNNHAKTVIEHPNVMAVTLTGSHQTGKIIASIAGKALKKVVLELGGNDPYLILEDADLELAAEAVVNSRMNNAGQTCIAAKRILAVDAIRQPFQALVLKQLESYKLGCPTDPNVNLGPLAREDLRLNLDRQIKESVAKGARILKGGVIPEGPGFYYPPTVLEHVTPGMPAFDEELFGPVITFIDAKDETQAIELANQSEFGLSAAVFTKNLAKGEHIALNALHTGTVYVNDFVRSDPRLPFGGIKGSGFGRELAGAGIHEFVNIKTIAVK